MCFRQNCSFTAVTFLFLFCVCSGWQQCLKTELGNCGTQMVSACSDLSLLDCLSSVTLCVDESFWSPGVLELKVARR